MGNEKLQVGRTGLGCGGSWVSSAWCGSLLGGEELVDLRVAQVFLARAGVDHQRRVVRRYPDEVVAELEDLLHLRLLFQQLEVSVALGLYRDHFHFPVKVL